MTHTKRTRFLCRHPAFPHPVEMPRASGCGYGRCRYRYKGSRNPLWTDGMGDCRYFQEEFVVEEGLRRLGKIIASAARRAIPTYRVETVVSLLPEDGGWLRTSAVARRAGLTRSNAYYWLGVAVESRKVETRLEESWPMARLWRRRNG